MDAWEYCDVDIYVEGSLLGPKKWLGRVVYYSANGGHRVEKLTTDYTYDPDRPTNARDAMGQVLALLGQQGWDLVRYNRSVDSQVREGMLKRRKGSG
jgi:hypothetical protein